MVDPAQAKVRLAMKYLVHCQLYTINRSTRTLISFDPFKFIDGVKTQRTADGNGMPHSRLRLIWRNYNHLSKILYRLNQVVDAGSSNAIIIGDQDNRFAGLFTGF